MVHRSSILRRYGLLCGMAVVGWLPAGPSAAQALKLDDRLNPPQVVRPEPLPATSGPQLPGKSRARVPAASAKPQWTLPLAEIPRVPTATAADTRRAPWPHPATDQPLLPLGHRVEVPVEPLRPTVRGAYVRGPRYDEPLTIDPPTRLAEPPPKTSDDPKSTAAFSWLTLPVAALGPLPAPLLRLTIPDPFATQRASRMNSPDLDRDPPAIALDRPPPPSR